ncbi:MAG: histidine kinase [Candidatus Promineifilaceae bacterium]
MIGQQPIHEFEQKLAVLSSTPGDRLRRIDALNDLAWALADTDMNRAQELAEEALGLAGTVDKESTFYELGRAYALRTCGYLHQRFGDYPLGLKQLYEAQETFTRLQDQVGLCDVLDGMAGIYFQIGEYQEALDFALRQIKIAESLGDQRRLANGSNNLGSIYFEINEPEKSRDTHLRNLQLARAIGYERMICLASINLAENFSYAGESELALQYGRQALQQSQETRLELFEIYALTYMGKAYFMQEDNARAIICFEQALASSRLVKSKASETEVLIVLAQTHYGLRQLDRARTYAESCLAIATDIDARNEWAESHLLLSHIFEDMGESAPALQHYQKYHQVRELLLSDKAGMRLQVMKVVHDLESAEKEAEIAYLRNVELQGENEALELKVQQRTADLQDSVHSLQKEIKRRELAEAEIQEMVEDLEQRVAARSRELAALYDMTILYTEAQSLAATLEPALRNIQRSVAGSGIAVHLLSADKSRFHLAAHLGLGDWDQLNEMESSNDFMKWLEQADTPLMFLIKDNAYPFLPQALLLPDYPMYFGTVLRVRGEVIGMLSVYRDQPRPFSFERVSLLITMSEQLGIIIQNQVLQEQSLQMTRVLERQRLARELHDSVAQRIYSLHLFARAGVDAARDKDLEEARQRLRQIETNTLFALREMRLLLYQLRPLALESQSLVAAFEERFELVERRLGIEAAVKAPTFLDLNAAEEEELYFIINEALNNALQHGEATRVELLFALKNEDLEIVVRDNGRGFDPEVRPPGQGLENIRKRTESFGGILILETSIGEGTTIRIKKEKPAKTV